MSNEIERPAVKIEGKKVLFPVSLDQEEILSAMGMRILRPGQTVERIIEKSPVYMAVPPEVLWVEVENEKEKKEGSR